MIYQDIDKLCSAPVASTFIFTYNQEKYIREAIDSLLSQICSFEFEIIICDDCSKDSTLSICMDYQKSYPEKIMVVSNDQNLGMRKSYFLNILSHTRGQYIACCAGDDWWSDKYKLEKQVSFLQSHEDYGLVHSKAAVYVDKEKRLTNRTIGSNRNTFNDNLLTNHIAALTMCYTFKTFKEYVEEIDPVNLPYSEDYPLVLWYSFRSKIYFLNEVTSVYRYLINSVSHPTDIAKIYKGPKNFFECGMFFIKHFEIRNEKLIKLSLLRYHLDSLKWAYMLSDTDRIDEANRFFKENGYYLFLLLSKLFKYAGTNVKKNSFVFRMGIVLRRIHPTYKEFY